MKSKILYLKTVKEVKDAIESKHGVSIRTDVMVFLEIAKWLKSKGYEANIHSDYESKTIQIDVVIRFSIA